jgi:hypothetical protein
MDECESNMLGTSGYDWVWAPDVCLLLSLKFISHFGNARVQSQAYDFH